MIIIEDYFAEWCGPCKGLHKILDEIQETNSDIEIKYIDIDDEENRELVNSLKIRNIPFVRFLKDDEVIHTFVGIKNKIDIEKLIDSFNE